MLKRLGRRAADAGAQAAAAAAAAGSSVVNANAAAARRAAPVADADDDAYHEPFGDVAGPGVLPTLPKKTDGR